MTKCEECGNEIEKESDHKIDCSEFIGTGDPKIDPKEEEKRITTARDYMHIEKR